MKLIMILIAVPFLFIAPAFSDLTPTDINNLRLMVKEEVESAVAASETRIKDYVSQEIKTVNVTISEMDKRLNQIFALVIALIAFIVVVVGIPQILVALQRKDVRAQDEKIEAQNKQMEVMRKQI